MVNRAIGLALLAGAALLVPSQAEAQCTGQPSQNQVCAGPTAGSGLPKFRALIGADLPGGGTTTPGTPVLSYQWNNSGIMTGSPTFAHTAAGVDTLTGILNIIGTLQNGGTPIAFPPSGVLLGVGDAQTVTNKTFDSANNTLRISGITVSNRSGNSGRIPFINNAMVSGNCLTLDANGNIADQGAPCSTGGGGSGTVNNGTQFQAAYYGATGTAVIGNPNFLFGTGGAGNMTLGISGSVMGSTTYLNTGTGSLKVQAPTGALGTSVLTWPARTADIATTFGALNNNNCAKFDSIGNIVDNGSPCSIAGAVTTVFGRPGPTISAAPNDYSFSQISSSLSLAQMPPSSANTVYGNIGSGAQAVPVSPCSGASNALTWTAGSGFGCNTISAAATPPGGTSGQIEWNNGGTFAGFTMSQDCTIVASTGVITCLRSNNVTFKASATTDTTNASNITSGTLSSNQGGAGTINGALKGNGAGVVSQAACTDLTNGATGCSTVVGTAATMNTGIAGATVPLLNGTNTWSGANNFTAGLSSNGTGVSITVGNGPVSLGTGAIASGTCASTVTVTTGGAANVLTTDVLSVSFNGDPTGVTGYAPTTNGMLTIIPWPAAGSVNFKVCNNTFGSITPGAITLNWRVNR